MSYFIEFVYLVFFILGYLYDYGYFLCVVCCCFDCNSDFNVYLLVLYYVNYLWLGCVIVYDLLCEIEKINNLSVNWLIGDMCVEVIDGCMGVCMIWIYNSLMFLCVCKVVFYMLFKEIVVKVGC